MFNIGGGEMILLAVLALLVFGPEGLPDIMKTAARTIRAFKAAANDFQSEVSSALNVETQKREVEQRRRKRAVPLEQKLEAKDQAQLAAAEVDLIDDGQVKDDVEQGALIGPVVGPEPISTPPEASPLATSEPLEIAAGSGSIPNQEDQVAAPAILPQTETNTVAPDEDDDAPGVPMTRKPAIVPDVVAEPSPNRVEPESAVAGRESVT